MTATALARGRRLPTIHIPGLHRASAVYLLGLIILIFGLWIPDTFLSTTTFKLVFADQVVVAILAVALLVPLTAGTFDLAVGQMLAFSLVIVSWLEAHTGLPAVISCLIALVCCAAAGFLSGVIIVHFRVNSFIATLGMSQVIAAATFYISENKQIVGVFSDSFLDFGRRDLLGIPIVVYYLAVVAVIVWYVLEQTPLGRHLFATGANPESARLSGVRTDRLVWGSLVASAVIAGLAGIIYGAKVGSFSNSFGPPMLFPAFAAVFFGSTQIRSRPNVWGTMLAVYTLAFGVKGLQLGFQEGVYWINPMFNGVALVLAVALASRRMAADRRRRSIEAAPAAGEPDASAPGSVLPGTSAASHGTADD